MNNSPSPYSVSIILPVINETFSLRKTVEIIIQSNAEDLAEILIVFAKRTTQDALREIELLTQQYPALIRTHEQQMPYIGGAMREAFDRCLGSHVIMMASDLETDPQLVEKLISISKKNPKAIVTVSRWIQGGGFNLYSPIKLVANWIFQKIFSLLFWTKLTDMTYAYRILPSYLVKEIQWEELRHPFLFETIIKPLRLGVIVFEIPGQWSARLEGDSQNTFMRNFDYFRVGLRVRLMQKSKILNH
jgi:glycosyltransferase involved in cell wall biosynthesis